MWPLLREVLVDNVPQCLDHLQMGLQASLSRETLASAILASQTGGQKEFRGGSVRWGDATFLAEPGWVEERVREGEDTSKVRADGYVKSFSRPPVRGPSEGSG